MSERWGRREWTGTRTSKLLVYRAPLFYAISTIWSYICLGLSIKVQDQKREHLESDESVDVKSESKCLLMGLDHSLFLYAGVGHQYQLQKGSDIATHIVSKRFGVYNPEKDPKCAGRRSRSRFLSSSMNSISQNIVSGRSWALRLLRKTTRMRSTCATNSASTWPGSSGSPFSGHPCSLLNQWSALTESQRTFHYDSCRFQFDIFPKRFKSGVP